jgi:ribonuclease BN (tRNA processing enzyme)
MKVVILGCSRGHGGSQQYLSSYLINGTVAVDAGCLGLHGTPRDQETVRHVLLTHAHADHIATLPLFIENVWNSSPDCPSVYGSPQTLDALRRSIFNNEIWPDFVALSERMPPFLRLQSLQPEVPFEAGGLTVTPVWVDHSIPTFGYVVQDGGTAVIFAGDSGPTTRLWEVAHETAGLRAVFLEASFPNSMRAIAEASRHLTAETFRLELAKIPAGVKVIAVHLKVRYRDEIIQELNLSGHPFLEIGECGRQYVF